jgi:quercetin dioxygenase-like cupin family protein
VSGRIDHLVGEEWYEMGAGDAIHVPQGVWHQGRNQADEPAILVISYNTGRRQTVGEGFQ